MRKLYILAALLLVGLLVGCNSSGGAHVEDARALLDALNTGDVDAARTYLCEEDAQNTIDGLATIGADERQTWAFQNINCRAEGEDVRCTYNIVEEMEDGTQEGNAVDVVFNVDENGKFCGFEEPIGE